MNGYTYSAAGTGVVGLGGIGVEGSSNAIGGIGVYAFSGGSTGSVALVAANYPSNTTDIAIFRLGLVNKARIDAAGKGWFNGGTATTGADFAESVAVDRKKSAFEPGDVIVIDREGDRRFALSSTAESPLVAGVYSTKPGVLATPHDVAGDEVWTKSEIPLAVVGLVPCKVCAEGGPIERGDLLVTSSLPGRARKAPANPKAGTILGKALGRLEKGEGTVEVLLMAR